MHKLTVLRSTPMIEELMRRLAEASITASSIWERGIAEIYAGTPPSMAIWVVDAEDLQRAAEILREVQAEQTYLRCPHCRYDLRGHTGKSACPECGRPLTAPSPEVECPKCGELVPPSFEVCWNCGSNLPDKDPPPEPP